MWMLVEARDSQFHDRPLQADILNDIIALVNRLIYIVKLREDAAESADVRTQC